MSKAKKKPYRFNKPQQAWLKALEHGRRKQARGMLFDGAGYCCLGVACRVLGMRGHLDKLVESSQNYAPDLTVSAMRLSLTGQELLASLNDQKRYTFAEIAAFIRANPEKVFLP